MSNDAIEIANAKTFFKTEVEFAGSTKIDKQINSYKTTRQRLTKNAVWDSAYVHNSSLGKIVIVPIKFKEKRLVKIMGVNLSLNDMSFLYIYKDKSSKMRADVVTMIPDEAYLSNPDVHRTFSGIINVDDWKGNFVNAYAYNKDQAVSLGAPKEQTLTDDFKSINSLKVFTSTCYTVTYGTCVYVGSTFYGCSLDYAETFCITGLQRDPYSLPPSDYVGGGGGDGGAGNTGFFDPLDLYNIEGTKPLAEKPDPCAGVADLWARSVASNQEVFGVVTKDGKFLTTEVGSTNVGYIHGLYLFDGAAFYEYPDNLGAPTQTYLGMVHAGGHYYIPIAATVHSHTPCLTDGTDGVSNMNLSPYDAAVASKFNMINHYVIGCSAVGQYSTNSSSYTLLQSGQLSITCTVIH